MATIHENEEAWSTKYSWSENGDEWSIPWGGVTMQWHKMLLPRIHRFISTGNTLEIACGRGRWTQFLKDTSNSLIGIDLSKNNIDFCKTRFKQDKNVKFYKNDGKSLQMIKDNSIDFIFSCDSLVHVSAEVLEAYISQFDKILKPNGVIFIHHSNLREYKGKLTKNADIHWRDKNVDAKVVEKLAKKHNLQCISQEKIQWISKTKHFIDCFSIITKKNSIFSQKNKVFKNANFQKEIKSSFILSHLHSTNKIKIPTLKHLFYVIDESLGALNLSNKQLTESIDSPFKPKIIKTLNQYLKKHSQKDLTAFIVNFLVKKNAKKIIAYGMGEIFSNLEKRLKKTNIKILHVIDKKAESKEFEFKKYKAKPKSSLLKLNANIPIIIASFAYADEIVKDLEVYKKENSLKNEIYDLYRCLTSHK